MTSKVLLPEGWRRPRGYSNGLSVEPGRLVFLAGVIGWNGQEEFESESFADQYRQVLLNIVALLREAQAKPEHIVRMTMYITDKREYFAALKEIGHHYREILGEVYPTMACVEVSALMEDRAKVEIETTAVIPIERPN
jgi:enamine deaminase RidA (YjgF/YER057c/UK114 family)